MAISLAQRDARGEADGVLNQLLLCRHDGSQRENSDDNNH